LLLIWRNKKSDARDKGHTGRRNQVTMITDLRNPNKRRNPPKVNYKPVAATAIRPDIYYFG